MNIPFTKMVGAGNDFLIVDARRPGVRRLPWRRVSQALCDRRDGVGADGLLVLERSRSADVRMRVFNPDGSEAEMCGNGARCVALYLRETGDRKLRKARRVKMDTKAGLLSATVRARSGNGKGRAGGARVAMRMTDPTELSLRRSVALDGRQVSLGFVNTGVPHAVVPVNALDRTDVIAAGRRLRHHRQFAPRGTNVDFIQPDPRRPGRLRVRTYERGVEAETPACGTGVAASAIIHALRQAGRMNGRTGPAPARRPRPSACGTPVGDPAWRRGARLGRRTRRHRVEVQTRSGDLLTVSFQSSPGTAGPRVTDVVLEGPARRVFAGTVTWPREAS